MRFAYIGNFEPPFSTENDVKSAIEHLGHTCIALQENNLDWDILNSYEYDILLFTSTWSDVAPLEQFLDLFKGCADRNIPTCTLHLDTFWGTSRGGRKWWLEAMFHTAYIFTADGDYQDKWKALGKNHYWLPPAIRHDAVFKGDFHEEYACDLAFVGSNGEGYHEDVWTYRKELIAALKEMSARNGWTFRNPGGELDKPDAGKISRGKDMNDFYASAKITVGDSLCLKKEQSHYWSDRVPECTGRNGVLIMPQIFALRDIYEHLPMYAWGDFDSLESMIKKLLDNKEIRERVREESFEITKSEHTYVNRVETILETLQKEGAL